MVLLTCLLLTLLAVGFLTLAAVGNSLTTLREQLTALQSQITATADHQVWQHRVTRKALVSELKKVEGYHEPELSELERAMVALERGDEPAISLDFGASYRKVK